MAIGIRGLHISVLSVTNHDYGTGPGIPANSSHFDLSHGPAGCLRSGPAGTIFPTTAFATSSRFQLPHTMTDEDERELENELARLQQEHRDLDAAIDALHQSPAPDLLRLQRLKKRKLQLRDRIAFIEDQITPDIIA